MINFATIGTNFVVDWFLEAVEQCDNLCYVATYSRDKEKGEAFSKKHNGKMVFTDLNKLAKCDEIHAVYIASPNSLHYEHAKLLIENGKHVMIEKTITSNQKELEELINLAIKHNVVIMEAMRNVIDPGFFAIKEAIELVKPVRRVSFQYCQYSSRYDKYKQGIFENAFRKEFSNGALTDIGVYCMHPLVKLFGMPQEIMAMAQILPDSIDGQGTIIAKYPEMLAEVLYSKITNSKIPSQIQGEKGAIIIEDIPNPRKVKVIFNDNTEKIIKVPECENNLVFEAKEWARLIEIGKFTDEHIKYSHMCVKVMDEARRQQGVVFPAD